MDRKLTPKLIPALFGDVVEQDKGVVYFVLVKLLLTKKALKLN